MTFKMNNQSYQDCLKDLHLSENRYNAIVNVLKKVGSFGKEIVLYNDTSWNLYAVDKKNRVFYFNCLPYKTFYDNLDSYELKVVDGENITLYDLRQDKELNIIARGRKSDVSELIVGNRNFINGARPDEKPKYIKYQFDDILYTFDVSSLTADIDIKLIKGYLDKDNSFFNFFNLLKIYLNEYNSFTVRKENNQIGSITIDKGILTGLEFTKEEKIELKNGKISKEISVVDNMTIDDIEDKVKKLHKVYKKED